jgi:hypothetical protein
MKATSSKVRELHRWKRISKSRFIRLDHFDLILLVLQKSSTELISQSLSPAS